MPELLDPKQKLEKVAGGFKFTEGPVFCRIGYLLFSDIPANRIHKWQHGTLTIFRESSNGANGLTFDHQGRLLACEKDGVTRTEKDGRTGVLAGGPGIRHPNDLVYAIDGSVYFTDLPAGAVCQVTRGGEVRAVTRDCERPNGIALSPDQQKLYVADSGRGNITVYDIAPDGGLRNGRAFAAVRTDGLKTDERGNVWLAGPGGIWVFDKEGQHLTTVPTPEEPSNLNWGEGFRGLYITARSSVYRIGTRVSGTRTY